METQKEILDKTDDFSIYVRRHREIKTRYKDLKNKLSSEGLYKEMELALHTAERCELLALFLKELAHDVTIEDWYKMNETLSISGTVLSEAKKAGEVLQEDIRSCVLHLALREGIVDDKRLLDETMRQLNLPIEKAKDVADIIREIKKTHL